MSTWVKVEKLVVLEDRNDETTLTVGWGDDLDPTGFVLRMENNARSVELIVDYRELVQFADHIKETWAEHDPF